MKPGSGVGPSSVSFSRHSGTTRTQAPPFVLVPCTTGISQWFLITASAMMSISGARKVMDDDC